MRDDTQNPDAANKRLQKLLPDSGYGQGEVTASPLQMALVSSTIANHGALVRDRLIQGPANRKLHPASPGNSQPRLSALPQLLARTGPKKCANVVTFLGTLAHKFLSGSSVQIAGKTGTAQVDKRPGATAEDNLAHSWFTGFAPYDGETRIAFAVFVEHGGYGGALAAPIAGELVARTPRASLG